jgi:hypothetical protein
LPNADLGEKKAVTLGIACLDERLSQGVLGFRFNSTLRLIERADIDRFNERGGYQLSPQWRSRKTHQPEWSVVRAAVETRATPLRSLSHRNIGHSGRQGRRFEEEMVGRTFQIFLADRPDAESILTGLGWRPSEDPSSRIDPTDHFTLSGRDWDADLWGPSEMSWEDAPPEAVALQAGIAWHVEAAIEGDDQAIHTGTARVLRALRAIAREGHGVIADEDEVWRPGSSRRSRWTPPDEPTAGDESLLMIWWTVDPYMVSAEGLADLVTTLSRVLPEAIPVRWGDTEPLRHSLDKEGLDGLVRYLELSFSQPADIFVSVGTKTKLPISKFYVERSSFLLWGRSPNRPWTVEIEAEGSILRQPGWARQLSSAFRAVSTVVRPFYAEARVVDRRRNSEGFPVAPVPPVNALRWCGFPRRAPMAMVVGPPYTTSWEDHGGARLGDLTIYSSEHWPEPPDGGVPVAPEGMLQEFDPHPVYTNSTVGRSVRPDPTPTRQPEIWPFPDTFRPPEKVRAVADLVFWTPERAFGIPSDGHVPLLFRFEPPDDEPLRVQAIDPSRQPFFPDTTHIGVQLEFWSQAARPVVVPGAHFVVIYNDEIGEGNITTVL